MFSYITGIYDFIVISNSKKSVYIKTGVTFHLGNDVITASYLWHLFSMCRSAVPLFQYRTAGSGHLRRFISDFDFLAETKGICR